MDWIYSLFEQYGYLVLFIGLLTESLALPFPGELAMGYSGYLGYLGELNAYVAILCAFLGATIGTTITYFLGQKLGTPVLTKYGKYLFMTPKRIDKMTTWFEKYGSKILLISYFIPGFRHFTGYVSGILNIRLRTFLFFNHLGALLWITTYVMIGKTLGPHFEQLLHGIAKYSIRILLILIPTIIMVLLVRKYKVQIGRYLRSRSRMVTALSSMILLIFIIMLINL